MGSIILQGITLDQLHSSLMQGIEERFKEFVKPQQEPEQTKYLTRQEVADLLSISFPTINDWGKKKILNPYRIGNRVLYKRHEIDASLKRIND